MKLRELLVEDIEKIKRPIGGFIEKPLSQTVHYLGSAPTLDILNQDGHYGDVEIEVEIQKTKDGGDSYGCVIFSTNNCHEIIHKLRYGDEINFSDPYGILGCGVIKNRGTSYENFFEWKRKNFCAWENEMPFSKYKTVDELYADKINTDLKNVVKIRGELYEIKYQFLTSNSTTSLLNGLKYSPIVAAVEGSYVFQNGKIVNAGGSFCHSVLIIDFVVNDYWLVMDSESHQVIKFDWNYKFSSPSIHSFKKLMTPELYRKKGEKAIYFLNQDDKKLVPYTDGIVSGGSMFKTTGLTYSMANVVDELPYPIADYSMTTIKNTELSGEKTDVSYTTNPQLNTPTIWDKIKSLFK